MGSEPETLICLRKISYLDTESCLFFQSNKFYKFLYLSRILMCGFGAVFDSRYCLVRGYAVLVTRMVPYKTWQHEFLFIPSEKLLALQKHTKWNFNLSAQAEYLQRYTDLAGYLVKSILKGNCKEVQDVSYSLYFNIILIYYSEFKYYYCTFFY